MDQKKDNLLISLIKSFMLGFNKNDAIQEIEIVSFKAFAEHSKRSREDKDKDLINISRRMNCESENINEVKNFLHLKFRDGEKIIH